MTKDGHEKDCETFSKGHGEQAGNDRCKEKGCDSSGQDGVGPCSCIGNTGEM